MKLWFIIKNINYILWQKKNKLLLYRTNVKGSITNDIEFGELALNYNPESPFIMFKDNDGSVKKMGSLSDNLGESEYYTMSQKAITEQVKMPSNYNVKYPSLSNTTLKETLSNSHIKEAIENIDSNVASVSQKIIDNEDNLNTKLNHIKNSIGLTNDLLYKTQTASTYLQDSISLSNADYLLDVEVKKLNDALISEKERAEGQEAAIRTEFASADSTLRSLILDEKSRAEGQETVIRSEFSNADENLRRELTELIDDVSSNVSSNEETTQDLVNAEKERAEGQEEAIRTEFANADSNLRSLISSEKERAEGQEEAIRREFSKADENLRSSLTKLIDDVSSNLSSNEETTQHLVNAEKERAEVQEAAIRSEFASADSKLKSDLITAISSEKERAEGQEEAIRKNVEDTTNTLRNELSTLINAEIDRANKEDIAIREYFNNKIDSLDAVFEQTISLDGNGKAELNHIGFSVEQEDGKLVTFNISEKDIASAYELERETIARKAVDGQSGQTYAKNTSATYISGATSLNDADVKLNNAITAETKARQDAITAETKARQDAINALDATVSGNGTHVDVTVSQLNGKITGVSVAESDIASAAALTTEIAARKAVDGQTGQTYAKNTAATYISAATSLNDADVKLNNAIANLKITSATSTELTSLGTNVKEAYKLIDGNSTQHGNWIKIYKDSSLQEVYLGLSNDTINASTGVITKNTVPSGQIAQSLNFKYQLTDGTYSLVKVDVSKFLAETEYSDGLQVSNGVISVKKDSSSESFLSISSSGVKLSGVQNAINTAVNNLDATVSGNGTHVDVTVSQLNGKITGVSVAESDIASAAALTNLTNWCAYMSGHTTASAVTSIPTTKRLCIATISTSQTLGLNGSITDGREVHIIVKNNSTSDITVTIPSSITNLVGENLLIAGSSYGEINLTSDGSKVYYRGIGK